MDESYSEGISIAELLGIVKNHIVLLLVVFISVVVVSVGYIKISTPTYTASATISIEPIANLVNASGTKSTSTNITNEIQYLKSSNVVVKALRSMDLSGYTHKDGTDYSDLLVDEKALNGLVSNIGIAEIKGTNQVTISFEHANLEFANAFVTALHTAFDTAMLEISAGQLDKESALLKTMLNEAETGLARSEKARDEFQSNPRYVEYNANNETYNRILTFLEVPLRDVEPNALAEEVLTALEILGITDPTTASLVEDYGQQYRKLLYFEITQLINPNKTNEAESKNYYLEFYRNNLENSRLSLLGHLSLIKGQAEAEILLSKITDSVEYSYLIAEKQYYMDLLKEFRIIGITGENIQYELNHYKSKVVQYTNQLKAFEENRSIVTDPTSVIEPVHITDLDGNTNTLLILAVGLLLGLALGFLSVLLYDTVSDSLIDEFGIKKLVGDQIPILSTIPNIKKETTHSSFGLDVYIGPKSQVTEAFDQLAGIVQYGDVSNGSNIYSFSSLGNGESSISTVLNLAFSIKKNGKKVLIIGTNREETNYHDVYDSIVASDSSITKVSLEKMDLEVIKKTDSKLPMLHLASIDVKSHELPIILNSEDFKTTLQSASEVYDFILIDGPTFRSPSNLLAVARNASGLILNMRQGIASKKAMKQLLATASVSQVPILGIVFNTMFGRPSPLAKRRILKQRDNTSLSFYKIDSSIHKNKKDAYWVSG